MDCKLYIYDRAARLPPTYPLFSFASFYDSYGDFSGALK